MHFSSCKLLFGGKHWNTRSDIEISNCWEAGSKMGYMNRGDLQIWTPASKASVTCTSLKFSFHLLQTQSHGESFILPMTFMPYTQYIL
jgi:hypothetical protein